MNLKDKNILVVGLGVSGFATACFLKNRGAAVTVTDTADEEKLASYIPRLRERGILLELGCHRTETFERADSIVISPGVPHTIAPIKAAMEKGVSVLGEIELASRFVKEPIVAVTGTNGKTTTATLLGKMLEKSGFKVFVGGNIGTPLIAYADGNDKADMIVLEISSFQLDTISTFRPRVAVLLNITNDHLERYPNFAGYAESKARIFENQQADDFAVLNSSDPVVYSVTRHIKSRKLEIEEGVRGQGSGVRGLVPTPLYKNGVGMQPGRSASLLQFQIPASLPGKHNFENVSAACLAASAMGGTAEGIQTALDNFRGLPHRIAYVATINSVRYFDDSKATNTDAVIKALECFDKPVVLIMGGRGKGGGYQELREVIRLHAKKLIAMGEAKKDIIAELGDITASAEASSMEDAVLQAYHAAEPGDIVLLSPACSSFDMYSGYAARGEHFSRLVGQLRSEN